MKEFLEAFVARVKSPVFAYFTFFFFTLHWDHIAFLLLSNDDITIRIQQMQEGVTGPSVIAAIGLAGVAAIFYPWVTAVFNDINQHAVNHRNEVNARVESNRLSLEEKFRKDRAAQEAAFVVNLAQTEDEGLEGIEDEEAKEKARERLDKIAKDALRRNPYGYVHETSKPNTALGIPFVTGESPPSRLTAVESREKMDLIISAVQGLGYSDESFRVSIDELHDAYKIHFLSFTALKHTTEVIEQEIAKEADIHPAFLTVIAPNL